MLSLSLHRVNWNPPRSSPCATMSRRYSSGRQPLLIRAPAAPDTATDEWPWRRATLARRRVCSGSSCRVRIVPGRPVSVNRCALRYWTGVLPPDCSTQCLCQPVRIGAQPGALVSSNRSHWTATEACYTLLRAREPTYAACRVSSPRCPTLGEPHDRFVH